MKWSFLISIALFVLYHDVCADDIKSKADNVSDSTQSEIELNRVYSFVFPTSTITTLSNKCMEFLKKASELIKSKSNLSIVITGHSDDQGNFRENDDRAKTRVEEAKQFLLKLGVKDKQIWTSWMGSINPVASNKTEAGRLQNRRLEIKIVE
jgi:outer membrane protein OmpA-like peptidoglycan-associated protein